MAYIYKITNFINGKFYIGSTTRSPEKRFHSHILSANDKCNQRYNLPMYREMRECGVDKFELEVVEECADEELAERERYWIQETNAIKDGYNGNISGHHKAREQARVTTYVICTELDGKNILFRSAVEAAKYCIACKETTADLKTVHARILKTCNGERRTAYNRRWTRIPRECLKPL